ncbi:MAG: tripartite tricarboxylate transporter TctB family protein [Phycisphaeraceae bacterium]|nr:tripartite tricarboxylate transporter TctB family protein [Phycisphaeraceae bacterium]
MPLPSLLFILLLTWFGGLSGCNREASYPSRPVTLICPWAAGGGTDRLARHMAVQLEGELGVPINVVNATGGGGVAGHMRGALARADGYTMTLATAELNILHWRELTSITYRDFEPLMQINRDDAALFVRSDAPWHSAAELAQAIRDNPRKMRASGTAFGGIWHLSVAGWLDVQQIEPEHLIWVSINGSNQSLQEMIAGRLELVCCSLPEARSLLDGGMIRALAVMSEERVDGFPDVPTLREQGLDWSMGTWRGLMLPRGVPADRVQKLREAMRRVTADAAFSKFMQEAGFVAVVADGEQFGTMLEDNDQRLGGVLKGPSFSAVSRQRIGVMFFPTLIGIGLLLTIAAVWWRGELRGSAGQRRLAGSDLLKAGAALGFIMLYVLAWEWMGFVLSTAMALAAGLILMRVRGHTALIIAVAASAITYQAFAVFLRVPLPWGWLGW